MHRAFRGTDLYGVVTCQIIERRRCSRRHWILCRARITTEVEETRPPLTTCLLLLGSVSTTAPATVPLMKERHLSAQPPSRVKRSECLEASGDQTICAVRPGPQNAQEFQGWVDVRSMVLKRAQHLTRVSWRSFHTLSRTSMKRGGRYRSNCRCRRPRGVRRWFPCAR